MIKFFRKIRQNLLSEGKTRKYLKYAIGEIILVVIGILIAIQINNWNENNKLEAKTQDYYQQLLEDLKKDKEFSQSTLANLNIYQKKYQAYLESFNETTISNSDMYTTLLNLPQVSTTIAFNSNTLESLINSSEIVLIPLKLRNKLIDLKRFQEDIISSSQFNDSGKTNIGQKATMLVGEFGLEERLSGQKELKESLNLEKNRNEIILTMEAFHGWKNHSEKTTIAYLNILIKDIDKVEDLIQKKVKAKR